MYPAEFEIKDTKEYKPFCLLLGLTPVDRKGWSAAHIPLRQRDDFFYITNFPFLSSNIPFRKPMAFFSQLVRYVRALSSFECFILRVVRLSSKLLGKGYVKKRLKSSLRKFYCRYGDLIKHFKVSLSQMLHDILGHDHMQ